MVFNMIYDNFNSEQLVMVFNMIYIIRPSVIQKLLFIKYEHDKEVVV